MNTDNTATTGRDDSTCTMKPHRLTCINPPGNAAGRRTKERSARAAVQDEEQPGTLPPGPEPLLREREPVSAGAAGDSGTGNRVRRAPSLRKRMLPGIRGHPPYVAIGEAMRKAKARNLVVFSLEPAGELPVHFVTVDGPCISLVRVRRLKYPGYTVEEIEYSCRNDIATLRSITVTAEIFRELWVRGTDRHWYRYLVLPGSVEVIEDEDEPDDHEPEGIEPHTEEPGTNQPDEKRSNQKEPDAYQPEEKEPGTSQPEEKEPGTSQPVEKEPGTSQPDEKEPGTSQPEEKRPGQKEPEAYQPVETEPVTLQPEGNGLIDVRPL